MIQGAGGQLVWRWGWNRGGGGGWGSDGQGAVTGVAAVAVGVTTIEVVAAEVAMVGVATRLLQRRAAVSAVWAHERDCLHAGEGGGDDGSDVAAIVLSG